MRLILPAAFLLATAAAQPTPMVPAPRGASFPQNLREPPTLGYLSTRGLLPLPAELLFMCKGAVERDLGRGTDLELSREKITVYPKTSWRVTAQGKVVKGQALGTTIAVACNIQQVGKRTNIWRK